MKNLKIGAIILAGTALSFSVLRAIQIFFAGLTFGFLPVIIAGAVFIAVNLFMIHLLFRIWKEEAGTKIALYFFIVVFFSFLTRNYIP